MSAEVRIALLRGVNVGGTGKLPMAEFRDLLAGLGLGDPRTYIQSGNAVFLSPDAPADIAVRIGDAIAARFGFRRPVFVKTLPDFQATLEACPFAPPEGADNTVHLFFLDRPAPETDLDALAALAAPTEAFHLTYAAFYLSAPDGIGRSALAGRLDRHLRVETTARNLRTVRALAALGRGLA